MLYFNIKISNNICTISLDRPRFANAYNRDMLQEFSEFLNKYRCSMDIRALIIHGGKSRHFCAGADLNEIANRTYMDGLELLSRRVFTELATWPHPTIAAIHGCALGGGLELALACDLRLGAENCILGFPEPDKGLIPAAGGCTRISAIAGPAVAKEMILFGRRLDGNEAKAHHLISCCVSQEELLPTAYKYAQQAIAQDPLANILAKRAIDSVHDNFTPLSLEGISQALLYGRKATQSSIS